MKSQSREFFTVDLRGLRAALASLAAANGLTESDALRGALSVAVGEARRIDLVASPTLSDEAPSSAQIKLSVRLTRIAAFDLDRNARAAGLSRGAYLARLIGGAPPVVAATDLAAGFGALSASASELAVLSRDIHHLTQLLRSGSVEAARHYRERLETLEADVRAHLEKAASVLFALSSARSGSSRAQLSPHLGR